jgi:hypothetical protein
MNRCVVVMRLCRFCRDDSRPSSFQHSVVGHTHTTNGCQPKHASNCPPTVTITRMDHRVACLGRSTWATNPGKQLIIVNDASILTEHRHRRPSVTCGCEICYVIRFVRLHYRVSLYDTYIHIHRVSPVSRFNGPKLNDLRSISLLYRHNSRKLAFCFST